MTWLATAPPPICPSLERFTATVLTSPDCCAVRVVEVCREGVSRLVDAHAQPSDGSSSTETKKGALTGSGGGGRSDCARRREGCFLVGSEDDQSAGSLFRACLHKEYVRLYSRRIAVEAQLAAAQKKMNSATATEAASSSALVTATPIDEDGRV